MRTTTRTPTLPQSEDSRSNGRKLMQPRHTALCETGVEAFGERSDSVTAEARKGVRLSDTDAESAR